MRHDQTEVISNWACLFITSFHHHHFAWLTQLIHYPWNRMHSNQVEWKPIQANLLIIPSFQAIHSQTLHDNTPQMQYYQREGIANGASLVIILHLVDSLSKTTRGQRWNASWPNRSDFRLGRSILHFMFWESLFNSNEAYQNMPLSLCNSPILIPSKEGRFSISHTE